MKKNMGTADKLIRVLIGSIIAALYIFDVISGNLAIVLAIIAIVLLLTSLFNFCPLYRIFGMKTCKTKE